MNTMNPYQQPYGAPGPPQNPQAMPPLPGMPSFPNNYGYYNYNYPGYPNNTGQNIPGYGMGYDQMPSNMTQPQNSGAYPTGYNASNAYPTPGYGAPNYGGAAPNAYNAYNQQTPYGFNSQYPSAPNNGAYSTNQSSDNYGYYGQPGYNCMPNTSTGGFPVVTSTGGYSVVTSTGYSPSPGMMSVGNYSSNTGTTTTTTDSRSMSLSYPDTGNRSNAYDPSGSNSNNSVNHNSSVRSHGSDSRYADNEFPTPTAPPTDLPEKNVLPYSDERNQNKDEDNKKTEPDKDPRKKPERPPPPRKLTRQTTADEWNEIALEIKRNPNISQDMHEDPNVLSGVDSKNPNEVAEYKNTLDALANLMTDIDLSEKKAS